VAVRRIAEGSFRRALFVAMRASDRAARRRPAAVAAIEESARTLGSPPTSSSS